MDICKQLVFGYQQTSELGVYPEVLNKRETTLGLTEMLVSLSRDLAGLMLFLISRRLCKQEQ